MARFTLAPAAKSDLNEIWRYLAEANEAAAEKFIRRIADKFQTLADHQEIGTRQDDFAVEMRMFPFRNYHIYYFTGDAGVEIYRILHGRRDADAVFEDYSDEQGK